MPAYKDEKTGKWYASFCFTNWKGEKEKKWGVIMESNEARLTSRDIQAKQTKSKLFEVAIKLFRENGYDNVKIEDITTAAGVSKGTYYLYFKTNTVSYTIGAYMTLNLT